MSVIFDASCKLLTCCATRSNSHQTNSSVPSSLCHTQYTTICVALLLARANAGFSSRELISIVANQPEDPEPTFEYNIFMRELLNHMRDTPDHPEVLAALLAAAGIRNTPQTWISVLACLLRSAGTLNPRITNNYLDRARRALRGDRRRRYSKRDIGAFSLGVAVSAH